MKIDKKRALLGGLALSVSLAFIFAIYSGVAYSREPVTTKATYSKAYAQEGHFTAYGLFSNETVYGNGTSLEYYPSKITDVIVGTYEFSSDGARGSYEAVLHVNYYVTSGKKRVYIVNDTKLLAKGTFVNSFEVPVELNFTELNERLQMVREGTGLYRAEREVYVTVKVLANGRESFTQEIRLKRDASGMLYFSGTDKEYQKVVRTVSTTTNSLSFAGSDVGVSTARTVFPAMALLFAIPPAGFIYAKREKKEREPKELKGLKKYTVEGTSPDGKRVELSSPKDLERVFELVDRPIVHYRDGETDVYAITDGETVYEYRAN
ncbi:DUF5305 family protein [Thermococcus nautili]|uniref:Uncharacterized protein n=1 Tax=Thermococcus nautili TaxID=195522 RepID=W8P2T0_9EURY|nr:DUF5305 family protein [Thermococcus nautili]AHL23111.1 hypothetical protein BD01_1503 [Thermococcus nautili]